MEVVVLNGSPKRTHGNSMLILDPFLHGLHEAGAKVDLLHLCDLNIKTCTVCYKCWYKTPGRCVINDDMASVLDRIAKADVWILSTSVYWGGPSSLMKSFMERLLPLVEPIIELDKGKAKYKLRESSLTGKIVLVSTSPKYDMEVFAPLITQIKSLSHDVSHEFSGALLRPHAPALRHMMDLGKKTNHIFDAAREAGRLFSKTGVISDELSKVISSDLITQALYIRHLNKEFSKALKETNKLKGSKLDDKLYIETKPHPFKVKPDKDRELLDMIVETVNLMGGVGLQAEEEYQKSLDALRLKSDKVVKVIIQEYKDLPEGSYVDRWSLVYLLGELRNPTTLSILDNIVTSRIPAEKSKVLHEYSTRAEELLIRTSAVEAIKRIAENKDLKALEILLKHTKHREFSIRRAAVQSFLEVGGSEARKKLLQVLPKEHRGLLDIRSTDARKVYQPVIFDRTEPVKKIAPPLPKRADERQDIQKRSIDDSPIIEKQGKKYRDESPDKPCCE